MGVPAGTLSSTAPTKIPSPVLRRGDFEAMRFTSRSLRLAVRTRPSQG